MLPFLEEQPEEEARRELASWHAKRQKDARTANPEYYAWLARERRRRAHERDNFKGQVDP